jgi:hypothetical protein
LDGLVACGGFVERRMGVGCPFPANGVRDTDGSAGS